MNRPIDDAFNAEVAAIHAENEEAYVALHRANLAGPTSADLAAFSSVQCDLDTRSEALRRRYFPRAHRISARSGDVYAVSPTGRARRVYSHPREMADDLAE